MKNYSNFEKQQNIIEIHYLVGRLEIKIVKINEFEKFRSRENIFTMVADRIMFVMFLN